MKHTGCCTLCDRVVFDVVTTFTAGELSGWPKQIGQPHDDARRVTLAFADGTTGEITLCGDCQPTPERMAQIHHQIRRAWAFEGTNGRREQAGGRPLTTAGEWRMGASQLALYDNIPLGVLCEERWSEAMERESRARS